MLYILIGEVLEYQKLAITPSRKLKLKMTICSDLYHEGDYLTLVTHLPIDAWLPFRSTLDSMQVFFALKGEAYSTLNSFKQYDRTVQILKSNSMLAKG